jgi:potassium channel subfamily K
MKRFPTLKDLKQNWVAIVTQFPLIAAILAPSSVLFDIPALTQHWLSVNERSIPSPTWSTVLSAVSLGFNILANALLVVRFSRTKSWPRLFAVVTRLSAICWLIKVRFVSTSLFGPF